MAHQFLFIVDPLPSLKVKTDTTLALIQEACARGIKCFASEIGDITLRDGLAHFLSAPITLSKGYLKPPEYLEEKKLRSCDDFSVVFMRKDPPVDQNFFAALLMLRCFNKERTLMINDPEGLLIANEKLFGQKFASNYYPITEVSCNRFVLEDFLKRNGRAVIKPLFGAGGSGVLVFDFDDVNFTSALELLTHNFSMPVMIQSYIEKAPAGDKRILLLDGEPLGAVLRVPQGSDHRANFHAGGSANKASINKKEIEIIKHLKPTLLSYGLRFVGIDIIDGYLTEINVTSPTCLIEMESLDAKPLRAKIIDYIEEKLSNFARSK